MKKTVSRVLVFALAAITVFTSGISHRAFAAVPSPTSNQVQVTGGTVSVNGTVTNISDKLKCTILTDATSDPNMTQTEKDRLSDSFQTLKKESASADFSAVAMDPDQAAVLALNAVFAAVELPLCDLFPDLPQHPLAVLDIDHVRETVFKFLHEFLAGVAEELQHAQTHNPVR